MSNNILQNIGDNCTDCGRSTAFGSGLFVNRIPKYTETQEGYLCSECQMIDCDMCNMCGEECLEYEMIGDDIVCDKCSENCDHEYYPSF